MRAVQNILPWSSTTQTFPNFHHDIVSIVESIVYIYMLWDPFTILVRQQPT